MLSKIDFFSLKKELLKIASCSILELKNHSFLMQIRLYSSFFLSFLFIQSDQRSLVAFVLARIVWNYSQGQEAALTGSLVSITLEQLQDRDPLLRQWAVIALGKSWENFESARWVGVRDSAHEKLFDLLLDPVPEVLPIVRLCNARMKPDYAIGK